MVRRPKRVPLRQPGEFEALGRPGDHGGPAPLKPWKEWFAEWEARVRYVPEEEESVRPTLEPPHRDLDGCDVEHDEGLAEGPEGGYIARWERDKEQHAAFTVERG